MLNWIVRNRTVFDMVCLTEQFEIKTVLTFHYVSKKLYLYSTELFEIELFYMLKNRFGIK